jgi:PAS domain S-box-containing protein
MPADDPQPNWQSRPQDASAAAAGASDSLARAQAVLASALDPIITIDAYGTILSASDSTVRVLGYRPDELIGHNITLLMPEPHRSRHDEYLARYRATGRTSILGVPREFTAVRKSGEIIPIEISVARVDLPGAPLPHFCAILRDISKRKRLELEQQLLRDLSLAIATAATRDDALLATLRTICESGGWDYAEAWIPGADESVLVHSAHWSRGAPPLEEFHRASARKRLAADEGLVGRVWRSGRAEYIADLADVTPDRFLRRDAACAAGLRSALAVPVPGAAGEGAAAVLAFFSGAAGEPPPIELVAAAVVPLGPVFRHREAVDALRASERFVQLVADSVPSIIYVYDVVERRCVYRNDGLRTLLGHAPPPREEIGWPLFADLIHPDDRHLLHAADFAADPGREVPTHCEVRMRHADGTWRWLVSRCDVLQRDEAGRPRQILGTLHDITPHKLAEEQEALLRQRLEELVAARTQELERSHERLRLADRLAAIGTLAAGLGHDMNNVLLPVRCRLDALKGAGLTAEAREQLDSIRQSVEYLQQLSEALHLLARDPDDPAALAGVTDLASWWSQVGPLLRRSVPRHASFDVSLPHDLPAVRVAPHRLTQAVLNLVVNSAEAIREGGRIGLWAEPFPDRRFVRLAVTDNGRGMPDEVRRRALDPFFTTKKRGLGTGLGLALVHGVVQSCGGTIQIDSAPARGTTVLLTLPTVPEPPQRSADPARRGKVCISIADARCAGVVTALVRAAGLEPVRCTPAGVSPCELWVTDPTPEARSAADRLLASRSCRGVVTFGAQPPDWAGLPTRSIERTDDFEQIRQCLSAALAEN